MKKISTIFDLIVASFFVFIVFLLFFSTLFGGFAPQVLAGFCTVLFSLGFLRFKQDIFKKQNQRAISKKKLASLETSLLYQTKTESDAFFCEFFKRVLGLEFAIQNGVLLSGETALFPHFSSSCLDFESALAISKLAREQGVKHLIIPAISAHPSTEFLKGLFESVSIFDSTYLLGKMTDFGFFPQLLPEEIMPKKSFSALISPLVSKTKARGFGFIGLWLVLFSFISPFGVYYSIFGSVLLVSASLLLFIRKK